MAALRLLINRFFTPFADNPDKRNKMSDRKAVIKNADMGEEMQQDAVDCATQALEKYNIEKVIRSRLISPPISLHRTVPN